MTRTALGTLVLGTLYLLHQDLWFWRQARPLVFGFMPIGLFYHAAFTVVTAVAMAVLVRLLWPAALDPDGPSAE